MLRQDRRFHRPLRRLHHRFLRLCAAAPLLLASLGAGPPPPVDGTVKEIVLALKTGDANRRAMAVGAVRGLSDARQAAVGPLLARLLDEKYADPPARIGAAQGLGDLRSLGPVEVASLLAAVAARGADGGPASVPPPPSVREAAADALLHFANRRPTQLVGRKLGDAMLLALGSRRATPALRETAATILSAVPSEISPAQLAHLVVIYRDRTEPPTVRGGALTAISAMNGAARSALPAIAAVIADENDDPQLRRVSARVKAHLDSEPAGSAPLPVDKPLRPRGL
jgi:hypothetical protein